jgi:hypothetical protein
MTRQLARVLASLALSLSLMSTSARAEEAKVPVTAADHLAMSRTYAEKATTYRAEAAYHKDMAREYAKAHPDRKSGARNPWTVEMEKHCRAIVKDAEKLAADAEWAAKFHEMHARELEGK